MAGSDSTRRQLALSGFAPLNILQDTIPPADLLKIILKVDAGCFFWELLGESADVYVLCIPVSRCCSQRAGSSIDIFTLHKLFYFEPS